MKYQFDYKQARKRRKSLGKTLAEIGCTAGINPGNLSRIETGERIPRCDTIASLANALKVSPMFFFGRERQEE